MKLYALLFILLLSFEGYSQNEQIENKPWSLKMGIGVTLLSSGDMLTFNYENELNYKINRTFASSFGLNLGKSNFGVYELAFFTQGNLNFYISPFKNDKKNDFRLGSGITYYHVSDSRKGISSFENGVLVSQEYFFENRKSLGYNVIIEHSIMVSKRLILGFKLITQSYFNDDINTGFFTKLGIEI